MIMRSMILLGALITLLMSQALGRAIDDLENAIQSDNGHHGGGGGGYELEDWVKMVKAPAIKVVQSTGSNTELECEVMGSPPPKIQWIRGHTPLNTIGEFESNTIPEQDSRSIVRVRSVLVIDHILANEQTFTCIGQSGSKMVYATTTVYGLPGHIYNQSLGDLIDINNSLFSGPRKPKITYSYTMLFDTLGGNVILPCQAIGRPRPEIYWMESAGLISGQDPRFKVLPTGELLITNFKWSDMGTYTCVAKSSIGSDSAQTFIYSLAADDE